MKQSQLVFLVSQPRSGSTLFQAILSNNNEIATVSEPWLLLPFLTYGNVSLATAEYNENWSAAAINDFIEKIGKESFDNDLSNFLLNQYAKLLSNQEHLVLDKTPRYYEILNEIIHYFPNARIIVLKRNPFSVLSSIIKTWGDSTKVDYNFLNLYRRDLLHAPSIIDEFSKKNANNKNVKVIKFEDFITDANFVMNDLYSWLGVKYDDEVLNYSGNKKYLGLMGDPVGVHNNTSPNTSVTKKTFIEENPIWKDFFQGYSAYLTAGFLKEYGGYSSLNSKETRVFNTFVKKGKKKNKTVKKNTTFLSKSKSLVKTLLRIRKK